VQSYLSNTSAQDILTKLTVECKSCPPFSLNQGLLRYTGRIWVGNDADLKLKLLSGIHSSPIGGHSWFFVTYRRVK
jgi:hypothetical protein